MDLFGMGFGEILLVLVIALIIWGPGKIPEIARTLGKVTRAFRKASFDLTSAVTRELSEEEKEEGEEKERSHLPGAGDVDKAGKSAEAAKPEPEAEDMAGSGDK